MKNLIVVFLILAPSLSWAVDQEVLSCSSPLGTIKVVENVFTYSNDLGNHAMIDGNYEIDFVSAHDPVRWDCSITPDGDPAHIVSTQKVLKITYDANDYTPQTGESLSSTLVVCDSTEYIPTAPGDCSQGPGRN